MTASASTFVRCPGLGDSADDRADDRAGDSADDRADDSAGNRARPQPAAPHSASPQPAVLWADADGLPMRLVVGGVRWRVSDRPTVITEPVSWWSRLDPDARAIAAAPRTASGWRFQATTDDGRSCVFDVRDGGDAGRWLVVKVYE